MSSTDLKFKTLLHSIRNKQHRGKNHHLCSNHNPACTFSAVPGEPSCAHGWSLYKNACYMHFPSSIGNKTWNEADSYCHGSKARLAQVSKNRHGINFIRDLVKHRNESSFWISQARKVYGNLPRYQSPRRGRRPSQCTKITKMHTTLKYEYCKQTLPFICQRGNNFALSYHCYKLCALVCVCGFFLAKSRMPNMDRG